MTACLRTCQRGPSNRRSRVVGAIGAERCRRVSEDKAPCIEAQQLARRGDAVRGLRTGTDNYGLTVITKCGLGFRVYSVSSSPVIAMSTGTRTPPSAGQAGRRIMGKQFPRLWLPSTSMRLLSNFSFQRKSSDPLPSSSHSTMTQSTRVLLRTSNLSRCKNTYATSQNTYNDALKYLLIQA
ncbi:Protein of unknown function [Pyronema omphalodes CBS 100304]|uniref:Uncharacterized protein n=1 Tax=Pyronema omphalodes (strain CBS 100304) TaxID=1076935 RepID=U4LH70_PYROM|nr:Protein of unknown function [Pyronema omphalodes CBS 100304]